MGGKLGPASEAAHDKSLGFSSGTIKWAQKAAVDLVTTISGVPKMVFLQDGLDTSALDTMMKAGAVRQAPLHSPLAIKVGNITPQGRLKGQPVAMTSLTINGSVLEARYFGFLVALTKELSRTGGQDLEAFLKRVAQIAMADGTDQQAFGALINSSTPSESAADFPTAVSTAISNLSVTSSSKVFILLSADAAKLGSSLMGPSGVMFPELAVNGGRIGAHVALRTAGLTGTTVAAIDADAVIANVGQLEVDVSDDADLIFNDDPTPGAQNVVSLFQTNSSAVRVFAHVRR